jgi:putative multiple sugar transport system substrate-binding protein
MTAIEHKKIYASGLLEQPPDVKVVCHDRFILDNPRIAYFSSAAPKEGLSLNLEVHVYIHE